MTKKEIEEARMFYEEHVINEVEIKNLFTKLAKAFQQSVYGIYGQKITLERAATYVALLVDDYGLPGSESENFPFCFFPLE